FEGPLRHSGLSPDLSQIHPHRLLRELQRPEGRRRREQATAPGGGAGSGGRGGAGGGGRTAAGGGAGGGGRRRRPRGSRQSERRRRAAHRLGPRCILLCIPSLHGARAAEGE
ncbi:hypothetical protein E2562_006930, partial [Oryza meyeriana var. granulata]